MANESEEYVQQIEEWAIHWAESVQQKDQTRLIGAMHLLQHGCGMCMPAARGVEGKAAPRELCRLIAKDPTRGLTKSNYKEVRTVERWNARGGT